MSRATPFERFDLHTITPQPWKNGAGLTREIAFGGPSAAEFDWRISVAASPCTSTWLRKRPRRVITLKSLDAPSINVASSATSPGKRNGANGVVSA